ncbi:hypothetical protein Tco_0135951, partial [Tanacetum coccineum]
LRWMIYLIVLADVAESVRDTIGFEYCLASSSGWTKSPVLWAETRESSLTGPKLVLDMTDKFEVGDRVMLKVSPWKGVIRFGIKGKLAPRYVGAFEILEIIGPVANSLKRSRISLVKVRWNSKRGPEFTWEREDYMMSKYPQLFVERTDESAS